MATRYDSLLMPGSAPPPRPNPFGDIRAAIKARKRKASEDPRNPLVAAGVYGGIEPPEEEPTPEPERPMQTLPARRITAPAPTPQEQAVGRQQLGQLERARAFSRGAERVAEPFVQFQGGRVDVPLSLAQGGANILGAIGVPGAERASAGIGEARQAVRERLVGEPETDVGTAANVAGIMRGAIGSYLMPSRVMGAAAQAAPAGSAVARAAQMAANPLGRAGLTNAGRVNRAGQLASGALLTAPLDVASSFSPDAAATGLTAIGEAMEGQPGALPAFLRGAGRVAEPFAETQAGRTAFELLSGLVPSAAVTGVGAGVSRARGGMARGRLAEALASGDMAAADRIRTAEAQRRVGEGVALPGAAVIPEQVQVPRKPTGEQMARAEFEAEADRLQAVIDGPDKKAARAARKALDALVEREARFPDVAANTQFEEDLPQRPATTGRPRLRAPQLAPVQPAPAPGFLQRAKAALAEVGTPENALSLAAAIASLGAEAATPGAGAPLLLAGAISPAGRKLRQAVSTRSPALQALLGTTQGSVPPQFSGLSANIELATMADPRFANVEMLGEDALELQLGAAASVVNPLAKTLGLKANRDYRVAPSYGLWFGQSADAPLQPSVLIEFSPAVPREKALALIAEHSRIAKQKAMFYVEPSDAGRRLAVELTVRDAGGELVPAAAVLDLIREGRKGWNGATIAGDGNRALFVMDDGVTERLAGQELDRIQQQLSANGFTVDANESRGAYVDAEEVGDRRYRAIVERAGVDRGTWNRSVRDAERLYEGVAVTAEKRIAARRIFDRPDAAEIALNLEPSTLSAVRTPSRGGRPGKVFLGRNHMEANAKAARAGYSQANTTAGYTLTNGEFVNRFEAEAVMELMAERGDGLAARTVDAVQGREAGGTTSWLRSEDVLASANPPASSRRRGAADFPVLSQVASTGLGAAYGVSQGETPEERVQRGLAGAALGAMGPRLAGRGVGLSTVDVGLPAMRREALEAPLLPMERRSVGRVGFVATPEMYDPGTVRNQKLERAHVAEVDQTLRATAPQLYRNVKVSRGRGLFDGGVWQNVIHRFLDTDDDQTVRLAAAVQGLVTGQDAQIFYRPVRPGDAPMAPDGMRGVTGAVLVSGPDGKRLSLRAAREVIDNARALGVGGATFDEDNGVLYFVNVKGYSDTPLDDATYQRAITQAAEQATSLPSLTLSPTSLYTEFLNGPRDYFDALAGDAAGLALADRILRRTADAYRRYAKRIGADVADTERRLTEFGDELRARAAGLTETGTGGATTPTFGETVFNRVDRVFEDMPIFQPKPGAVWLARFEKGGRPIRAEMEYMGLRDFLQQNANTPLTREQVAEFLTQRRIVLDETRREPSRTTNYTVSVPPNLFAQAQRELGRKYARMVELNEQIDDALENEMDEDRLAMIYAEAFDASDEYSREARQLVQQNLSAFVPNAPLGDQRVVSQLTNRAEKLLGQSLQSGVPESGRIAVSVRTPGAKEPLFGAFRAPEFASGNIFEVTVDLPRQRRPGPRSGDKPYKSPHFDDTKSPPMMHIRGSEQTLPGGRKRVYDEETQDDWAQDARKYGVGKVDQQLVDRLLGELQAVRDAQDRFAEQAGYAIAASLKGEQRRDVLSIASRYLPAGQPSDPATAKALADAVLPKEPAAYLRANMPGYDALREQFKDLALQYQKFDADANALVDARRKAEKVAPPRPYLETSEWLSLALKRFLYEAAKRGADEVVLSTGEQAARAVGGDPEVLGVTYDQMKPDVYRRLFREYGLSSKLEPLPPGSLPAPSRPARTQTERRIEELELDLEDLRKGRQANTPEVQAAIAQLDQEIAELQGQAAREAARRPPAVPNLRFTLTEADRAKILRPGAAPMGRVDPEVLSAVGGAGAGAVAGAAVAEPGDREGMLTGALTGAALGGAGAGALARRMARPAQGAMTPAQQAVLGTIRVGDRAVAAPQRFLTPAERIYTKIVSETFPLEKAAGSLGEALGRPEAREQMQNIIRKAQGSGQAALQFLEDKLRPVLTTVGAENLGAVRALLKARRDLDIRQQGGAAKSTVDLPTLQQAVADGEANPRVAQAADAISDLYRQLLDMRYDADLLSDEQYLAILASDQYYVPLIAELTQPALASGSRGTAWSVGTSGVARMNREAELLMDTADPIELLVSAAQRTFRDVGKAAVANTLGELADLGPNPLIQPVNRANVGAGAMTFNQMRGGKQVTYEVTDRELYHAIAGAPELTQDWFTRMARALKNLQTSGVTLVPAFAAANVIRDVPMSALQRLNTAQAAREVVGGAAAGAALGAATGEDESTFVNALRGAGLGMAGGALARPLGQTLLAMRDIAGNRAVYQQFLRDGGSTEGFFVRTPKDAAEILERLQRTPGFNPKDILNFRSYWDALRFIGSLGEQGPRLAAYKEALAEGKTPEQAVALAQDRTLRFANIGRSTKGIASVTPFWNAKVQGWDKLGRMLKNPKTYGLGVTAITAPTLALWSTNKDNPEYWERPTWERNLFWLVPKGEGGGFWRIPKPFELGALFASTPERLLDYATQAGVELPGIGRIASAAPEMAEPGRQLGRAAREMATSTFEGTVPLPQFAALPAQLMFNRDLFRDRPIVSRPELLPEQQVQPQSSAIARQAARLGMSPEQVDFVLRDVAGTSGQELLNVTDVLARRAGLPAPEPLPNAPITGMFARRFQTQDLGQTESEAAARERLRALDRVTASQREAERRGGPAAAARFEREYSRQLRSAERVKDLSRQLDSVSTERRKVQRNPNLTPEQRNEKLKQLRSRSATISRQLLRIPD